MHSQLTFIVLSIFYLFIHVQSADNTTVVAVVVVQNVTVIQNTTVVPSTTVVENTTVAETTFPPSTTTEQTTVQSTDVPSNLTTTPVLPKAMGASSYVEPPPHPLGYCIRSRIMCSKIRRCCKGPCDLNYMRCP